MLQLWRFYSKGGIEMLDINLDMLKLGIAYGITFSGIASIFGYGFSKLVFILRKSYD